MIHFSFGALRYRSCLLPKICARTLMDFGGGFFFVLPFLVHGMRGRCLRVLNGWCVGDCAWISVGMSRLDVGHWNCFR